ncbi:FecR domain-containing protein [Rariglobus hedericola]|uniref:Type II secretory pathway, component PulD n=1 Tax=Rariglobus hedericola TaxID=2597822 RepID=A0A556QQB9_9BACT|nr:FecR domain-containing protein [Rariglobus hedericola]TSJ78835.1 type II secretory pathway, component PulD [Rariglobus hedericola]
MKKLKLPKSLLVTVAAPALLAMVIPAGHALAQGQTETKIRLMADALRARDSGDLDTAKKNLEELLALAPNDATVQRLLSGVNSSIAARASGAPAADTSVAAAPSEPVAVTFPGASGEVKTPAEASLSQADSLAKQENQRIKGLIADANAKRGTARDLAKAGKFDEAATVLDTAIASLPANPATTEVIANLQAEKNGLQLEKAQYLLKQGDTDGARAALDAYAQSNSSPDVKKAASVSKSISNAEFDPALPPIEKVSPGFIADQKEIAKLAAKGRSQYLAADADGAQETFRQIEAIDPNNPEAKSFLSRIAKEKAKIGELNRDKTRNQMLEEVANSWQRPGVYQDQARNVGPLVGNSALDQKLKSIIIPSVNFSDVQLSKVVQTLTVISEEYDAAPTNKGVNIVLLDPSNKNPTINITLRNQPLKTILDLITRTAGFQYEIEGDIITVKPGGDKNTSLETAFFAVTKSTVIRMTGIGSAAATPAASSDPFAAAPAAGGGGGGGGGEAGALRAFLQQAGVPFEGTEGSSLAYDGASIIVTQTSRNIERIRNILNRYNDVRQVEIEAKFMDVQEGALEELGMNWAVQQNNRNTASLIPGVASGRNAMTSNRTLANAFSSGATSAQGSIVTQDISGFDPVTGVVTTTSNTTPIVNAAPGVPGAAALGAASGNLLGVSAVLGAFDVTATIRALSQKSGTDLLSSPKVTVLSGNPANIVVAQELRYPQSYGETQSTVSSSNTGGSAISITAGTPQEFTTRNVGVELKVTPTVEEDDYSISLDLNPKVTEFEGFIEYGGQSVAIGGTTTVTVPSGFYQPIFSTREVTTKVTVWDGATLVMGGLTREEVKKTNDKVPLLGDIPLVGRLFRSKGESSSKRNLLIFVTANLVSPGGSPKKQQLKNVAPSSIFQNPTIVTPGSAESRNRGTK